MSKNPTPQKKRRHTYSMAQLRASAATKAESRPHEVYDSLMETKDIWELFHHEECVETAQGDEKALRQILNGWIGWPLDLLPEEARIVTFLDLAIDLATHPQGFALLSGVDTLAAGLENFRKPGSSPGAALSFCVNGTTYTAFEEPVSPDGYGRGDSSLSFMVAQPGNLCLETFEPCALIPELVRSGSSNDNDPDASDPPELQRFASSGDGAWSHSDLLILLDPISKTRVLSVGTRRDDSMSFYVGYIDRPGLAEAKARGIVEMIELAEHLKLNVLAAPSSKTRVRL